MCFSERIITMKKSPVSLMLSQQNWPQLAAHVQYEAARLAKYWGVSTRTLQREFRKQLRTTPQKHLDLVRIEEVRKLAAQKLRTKEIQVILGFKHAFQVCRGFKAAFGVGLKAYRNSVLL